MGFSGDPHLDWQPGGKYFARAPAWYDLGRGGGLSIDQGQGGDPSAGARDDEGGTNDARMGLVFRFRLVFEHGLMLISVCHPEYIDVRSWN